tara:strand:- start:3070 stop:3213 length:144 start_codon:yes stop_codon:yes gene_type:complete
MQPINIFEVRVFGGSRFIHDFFFDYLSHVTAPVDYLLDFLAIAKIMP